jgi:hypothetical protein
MRCVSVPKLAAGAANASATGEVSSDEDRIEDEVEDLPCLQRILDANHSDVATWSVDGLSFAVKSAR